MGCGLALNDYISIKDAVHMGCNRVFLFYKVKLDFYFVIDGTGIESFSNEFLAYRGNNYVNFVREQIDLKRQIPESYTLQ